MHVSSVEGINGSLKSELTYSLYLFMCYEQVCVSRLCMHVCMCVTCTYHIRGEMEGCNTLCQE